MSHLKVNVLSVLSGVIAVYFIWAFHMHVEFPPAAPLTPTAATYLVLLMFFFVLPFAQRLRIGKLIEFEAKVEQVRAEVKEVRTETRELLSTVSVLANTISVSMSQSVVVNVRVWKTRMRHATSCCRHLPILRKWQEKNIPPKSKRLVGPLRSDRCLFHLGVPHARGISARSAFNTNCRNVLGVVNVFLRAAVRTTIKDWKAN